MPKLNINRDQPQPSDEQLLKRMDFEKVLSESGVVNKSDKGVSKSIKAASSSKITTILLVLFGIIIIGLVIEAVSYFNEGVPVEITKIESMVPSPDDENIEEVTEQDLINEDTQTIEDGEMQRKEELKIQPEIEEDIFDVETITTDVKPIFEPQQASGIVFNFAADFNMQTQYQKFEELSSFNDLRFQPIGDFEPSILDISWDDAILSKNGETYSLELIKKGNAVFCEVVPVFIK